jgi:Fe-S-cluster containining protein
MSHQCSLVKEDNRLKLDACCQYGADTDLGERDAILSHREQIAAILQPEASAKPWFTADETADADFASGAFVRTQPFGEGCIFLQHDQRGCAIHRASIEGGWDFRGVKPHVCRLFPLTYDSQSIILSDDYPDYDCAGIPSAPSVYRVSRDTLGDVFGPELIAALDAVEQQVVARSELVSIRATS